MAGYGVWVFHLVGERWELSMSGSRLDFELDHEVGRGVVTAHGGRAPAPESATRFAPRGRRSTEIEPPGFLAGCRGIKQIRKTQIAGKHGLTQRDYIGVFNRTSIVISSSLAVIPFSYSAMPTMTFL